LLRIAQIYGLTAGEHKDLIGRGTFTPVGLQLAFNAIRTIYLLLGFFALGYLRFASLDLGNLELKVATEAPRFCAHRTAPVLCKSSLLSQYA
jgi:hypothetical protein